MRLLAVSCIFFHWAQTFSQDYQEDQTWYNGEIFLNDSSSKVGKIKYDFSSNIIVMKALGKVAVYNPSQFYKVSFSVTDSTSRAFIVKSKKNHKGFLVAMIFEELVAGSVTLFAREEIIYYSTGTMATQGFNNKVLPMLIYNYFFQKENGEIISFNNNKRNVLRIMKSDTEEVKDFIKENKLRYSQKRDLIKIFNYYNKIDRQ